MCQVELGEGTAALAELRSVLAEEQRALPAAVPELFALRPHIAMLAAKVGEVTEARRELRRLLDDVGHVHGRRSTAVKEIDTLLNQLDQLDRPDDSDRVESTHAGLDPLPESRRLSPSEIRPFRLWIARDEQVTVVARTAIRMSGKANVHESGNFTELTPGQDVATIEGGEAPRPPAHPGLPGLRVGAASLYGGKP
ncbi:hypothetical protein [Micromonospora sp. DT233]|uniref:hypothetical protein n=1 Tax=Micromonospora sp. DT233 TaxID=3393432 RepID=UPI003CEE5774